LKNRIVEHNIRVMSKYYTRLTLSRMSQLLALSPQESESFLADMVAAGVVEAKIDRLEGVVNFSRVRR